MESVTEPNGFKLDMDGPEGSLNPLLRVRIMSDGLEVRILNLLESGLRVKKVALKPKC